MKKPSNVETSPELYGPLPKEKPAEVHAPNEVWVAISPGDPDLVTLYLREPRDEDVASDEFVVRYVRAREGGRNCVNRGGSHMWSGTDERICTLCGESIEGGR